MYSDLQFGTTKCQETWYPSAAAIESCLGPSGLHPALDPDLMGEIIYFFSHEPVMHHRLQSRGTLCALQSGHMLAGLFVPLIEMM